MCLMFTVCPPVPNRGSNFWTCRSKHSKLLILPHIRQVGDVLEHCAMPGHPNQNCLNAMGYQLLYMDSSGIRPTQGNCRSFDVLCPSMSTQSFLNFSPFLKFQNWVARIVLMFAESAVKIMRWPATVALRGVDYFGPCISE